MADNSTLDSILGALALLIALAGLWMLVSGVRSMGGKS